MPFGRELLVTDWLKQREPMLFISRVLHWEAGRLVAVRDPSQSTELVTVTGTGECTEALLLEAMGQAAELLYRLQSGARLVTGLLVRMEQVKLYRRVHDHETLRLSAELSHKQLHYVSSTCHAYVADEIVASAQMTHFYVPEA